MYVGEDGGTKEVVVIGDAIPLPLVRAADGAWRADVVDGERLLGLAAVTGSREAALAAEASAAWARFAAANPGTDPTTVRRGTPMPALGIGR